MPQLQKCWEIRKAEPHSSHSEQLAATPAIEWSLSLQVYCCPYCHSWEGFCIVSEVLPCRSASVWWRSCSALCCWAFNQGSWKYSDFAAWCCNSVFFLREDKRNTTRRCNFHTIIILTCSSLTCCFMSRFVSKLLKSWIWERILVQIQDLKFRLGRSLGLRGWGQIPVLALGLCQDKPCSFARAVYVCVGACKQFWCRQSLLVLAGT